MKTVLIIEDNPAISLGLKEMLNVEPYKVYSCVDGKTGINMALKKSPHVILLDLNLPDLNGFEVCRQIREKGFVNSIIMLTSRNDPIDKIMGLEIGADDYITKPFDSRELLARIRSSLRKSERQLKSFQQIETTQKPRRHLLSIMFTDIKDYSKKMNRNEKLALKLLETHNKIMEESCAKHSGKVIEIIGDAFVVSFESAVNALECASEIQGKFKKLNHNRHRSETINVRIGIHLGDVIEVKDGLKGDAVNIAARIQQNTKAGSISISDSVYNAVKNKVKYKFRNAGEHNLKNIKQPVVLYKVS